MRFVAAYQMGTGKIVSICPQPPDAPTAGLQLGPGELQGQFELPDISESDPNLASKIDDVIKHYVFDTETQLLRVVRKR